jgi:para-nitrobenzyl esterase
MNRLFVIAVGCILASRVVASASITDPVKTDAGLISGTTGTSPDVRVFKGIPFAAPPVGPLRWRAPQPVARWDGVRKADQFGPRCMQGGQGGNRGGAAPPPATSEDCLYVNVWTTAKAASDRMPVIVFAYGGGFTGGAGSEPRYDGEALAKKGVVFVTFNYRLGAFGFFAHPELTKESAHRSSGNYAFMDLIAVLNWVQQNIGSFGGDPSRVTIMGESAGAMLVSALVGSPEGKGLFHRAISESGAWMGLGIRKMTTLAEAEKSGVQQATALGATSSADLRAKSADEVLRALRASDMIVDGWIIPEDLSITFKAGRENDVDVLVGSNQDEGTFFARGAAVTAEMFRDQAKQRFGDRADAYLKLYPAGSDSEANDSSLRRSRDELAWHMRTWARLQSTRGKAKAYVFYFTKVQPGQEARGATHTAELAYAFGNLAQGQAWTDSDRRLADTMTSYWANFAAKGDPNGKGLPAWPAYKVRTSERMMILGEKVEAAPELDAARFAFFDAEYARDSVK